MELQTRIGLRLRELRKAKGLTQEAVAELIARSVDTVSLLERGKIIPSLETLDLLGRGLGLPLHQLLDFGDDPALDPETLALETAALRTIKSLPKPLLAVAVRQLGALSELA